MASIKVKFRPSSRQEQEGTIYYQIIHARTTRQLPSSLRIFPAEWDAKRSRVAVSKKSSRKNLLLAIREEIRYDVKRISKVIQRLESSGIEYSVDEIAEEFQRYKRDYTLFVYLEKSASELKERGKLRTSETYAAALASFRKFRGGKDVMLDAINCQLMETYEAWLKQRGLSPNTISFYTRILRAAYNRAVDEGIIDDRTPFRHVYTGIDKTVKRALPLVTIRKIRKLHLKPHSSLAYARDMFLLSFMLRGMSFIDMAFLKKTDLNHGYITYRRRKTGQQLTIKWTKEMQHILDRYPANPTPYLLPIIKSTDVNPRYTYRNAAYNINHNLKTIASKIGLHTPLTLYVARHSWASAAQSKGIPLSIISEGMGHDSETTTRIYLASLETTAVDDANTLILQSL